MLYTSPLLFGVKDVQLPPEYIDTNVFAGSVDALLIKSLPT